MLREYLNIIYALLILLIIFNALIGFAVKLDFAANTGSNDNYWFKLCVYFGAFAAVVYVVKRKKIFSIYNSENNIIVPKFKNISIALFAASCVIFAGILGTTVFFALNYNNYHRSIENQRVVYNEGNIYNHYCDYLQNGKFAYYDIYGKVYVDFNDVNHYDENGNIYVKTFKSSDTYYVSQINGKEINVPFFDAFVDENGNFIQIDSERDDFMIYKNYENGGYAEYYFIDNEDFKYFHASDVSWDNSGNMYIEGNLLK